MLLLGIVLGVSGGWLAARGRRHAAVLGLLATLMVMPAVFRAVTIPNQFSNGTTADADEVNENFDALAHAVSALEGGSSLIQFGRGSGCRDANGGLFHHFIRFATPFAATPIFKTTIDESFNSNGATWARLHSRTDTHVGVMCDSNADGMDWMAIAPGVHTIDGRMVQAGRELTVTSGEAIFFPQLFASPPVVLVMIDETVDNSGASTVRIINNVTTGGFEVWANSNMDALNWIAMDSGTYTLGSFTWEAGAVAGGCGTSCTINFASPLPHTPGLLATVNDVNDSGATWVRKTGASPTDASLQLDFNTENVFYVAFTRQ